MRSVSLTDLLSGATSLSMSGAGIGRRKKVLCGMALVSIACLGGCINVAAPDKPIVIELNINIRSEVIYMLAEDTAETIEENADIF